MPPTPLIRSATDHDLSAITALYAHHVQCSTGTFETTPPSRQDMALRFAEVRAKGLPWLSLTVEGTVVGFAYANWFRPREAFRFCAENSIYLAPEAAGQGWGHALLHELLQQCDACGIKKMVALVGDSHNHASIRLHQRLGFTLAATLRASGWKFDQWLDLVVLERFLGTDSPDSPPISHDNPPSH